MSRNIATILLIVVGILVLVAAIKIAIGLIALIVAVALVVGLIMLVLKLVGSRNAR